MSAIFETATTVLSAISCAAALGAVVGCLATVLLTRKKYSVEYSVLSEKYAHLLQAKQQLADTLDSKKETLQTQQEHIESLTAQKHRLSAEAAQNSTKIQELTAAKEALEKKQDLLQEQRNEDAKKIGRIGELEKRRDELIQKRDSLHLELHTIKRHKDRLEHFREAQEAAEKSRENLFSKMEKTMQTIFENTAKTSLTTNSATFKEEITKDLKTKIDEIHKIQSEHKGKIDATFESFKAIQKNMTEQTQSLIDAFRGNIKVQGNWGETIVENILKASGLQEGRDYEKQRHITHQEGAKGYLDFTLKLPNGEIIIDAKTSIMSYEKLLKVDHYDSPDYQLALKNLTESIRSHIDDLAKKQYFNAPSVQTIPSVCMFIPNDSIYLLVTQYDPELYEYAMKKRVVLVCAPLLFVFAQSILETWKNAKIDKRTQEIIKIGTKLHDKLYTAFVDLSAVQGKLGIVNGYLETITKRLGSGQGNALSLTKKLRHLSDTSKDALPEDMQDNWSIPLPFDTQNDEHVEEPAISNKPLQEKTTT